MVTMIGVKEQVKVAYSGAAQWPAGDHPFPVGRQFAESLGYLLTDIPDISADAFAGISNISMTAEIPVAERIPAEDASVDVAIVNGIFNLNPSRDMIFMELARVMRPGGSVYSAELILTRPMPAEQRTDANWFA
jgi:SAM-dependent methyltransferase